jgi:hypothetical protein
MDELRLMLTDKVWERIAAASTGSCSLALLANC